MKTNSLTVTNLMLLLNSQLAAPLPPGSWCPVSVTSDSQATTLASCGPELFKLQTPRSRYHRSGAIAPGWGLGVTQI